MTAQIAPSAEPLVRPKRATGPRVPARRAEASLRPGRRPEAKAGGREGCSLDRISPAGRGRPGWPRHRGRPRQGRPRPASSRAEAGRPDRSRERPRRTRGSMPERRVTPSGRWYDRASGRPPSVARSQRTGKPVSSQFPAAILHDTPTRARVFHRYARASARAAASPPPRGGRFATSPWAGRCPLRARIPFRGRGYPECRVVCSAAFQPGFFMRFQMVDRLPSREYELAGISARSRRHPFSRKTPPAR